MLNQPSANQIPKSKKVLQQQILSLCKKKDAVILAHNYQRPEIQEIAHYTGDSLGLSRQATSSQAKIVVFCGVRFMAETAYILNPNKLILFPEPRAGCPLADTITAEDLRAFKQAHPNVPVVAYVNSSADVKAESDICCTSSNAVKVVESLSSNEVIFIPDKNLGKYVASKTNKKIILWPGYCPTHHKIKAEEITNLKKQYPNAKFIAHPECDPEVLALADAIGSTSRIYAYARKVEAENVIIGSEMGMLYRLKKESPKKNFLFPSRHVICPNMKLTTLKKVYLSLLNMETKIKIDEDIRLKAYQAVQKMVEVS